MTDQELLELAAKAAGFLNWTATEQAGLHIETGSRRGDTGFYWNPLANDGDAFRLAVKLKLFVGPSDPILINEFEYRGYKEGEYADGVGVDYVDSNGKIYTFNEISDNDPYAATRRAIVRAAAEIGKGEQA